MSKHWSFEPADARKSSRCEHAVHQRRCPTCGKRLDVEQLSLLPPSAALVLQAFGAYETAVAWIAVHERDEPDAARQRAIDAGIIDDLDFAVRFVQDQLTTQLVADLYGKERGEVAHDVVRARERERNAGARR